MLGNLLLKFAMFVIGTIAWGILIAIGFAIGQGIVKLHQDHRAARKAARKVVQEMTQEGTF